MGSPLPAGQLLLLLLLLSTDLSASAGVCCPPPARRLDRSVSGPAFSFELLPEARVIRVTVPPGPEVSVRLCHQWALECEELSRPFHAQKVVSGGRAVELPYEFLLPCLCVEASFLQEDTVRRKKCPFQSWPGAYGPDFWASMDFTDHSQHTQMVLSSAPRCPLQLQASLCQRREQGAPCQDLPNATAHESDGWYVLEKVDLHPHLCFKFSFRNTSHVECPHRPGEQTSWSVSLETRARRLVLRFLSRVPATFSATGLPRDSLALPVYSVTQTRSSPVPLDLVIPFPVPGGCVLVWRSDVQFSWKHVLCLEVAHRHGGLLILALLAFVVLLGLLSVLSRRRSFSGPGGARPVLLLHAADSEAQRRLVAALAELLRAALGGARDVIVDVWDARRVARLGPLPWLWAARARVRRERGAVLLLCSRRRAPRAALCAPPRPAPLLAYFGRLGAPRRLPAPLRALPRFRLLRDLPRLLRALGAGPAARRPPRAPLQRCRRLEREAARGAARGTC
ncbi:interleukin-17 receptor E [Sorex fumeus]|uniref:interleukin-17 receptor E n=1 Tax=Sorex fumeus TaxID=62283 RepID=UPI0024AE28DE|nr:interleukin-17 receptor E [Sorex fumeus]